MDNLQAHSYLPNHYHQYHQHHEDQNTMMSNDLTSAKCINEMKSIQPYSNKDEYIYAMKEDLAEWFNSMYATQLTAETFVKELENGVLICQHTNHVMSAAFKVAKFNQIDLNEAGILSSNCTTNLKLMTPSSKGSCWAGNYLLYRTDARPQTFQARDNISNFIKWCRFIVKVRECLMFETEDLIAGKNEKNFILCLLEVARFGSKFGIEVPTIIRFEQEIEAELERESTRIKQSIENEQQHQQQIEQTTPVDDIKQDIEMELSETYFMSNNNHNNNMLSENQNPNDTLTIITQKNDDSIQTKNDHANVKNQDEDDGYFYNEKSMQTTNPTSLCNSLCLSNMDDSLNVNEDDENNKTGSCNDDSLDDIRFMDQSTKQHSLNQEEALILQNVQTQIEIQTSSVSSLSQSSSLLYESKQSPVQNEATNPSDNTNRNPNNIINNNNNNASRIENNSSNSMASNSPINSPSSMPSPISSSSSAALSSAVSNEIHLVDLLVERQQDFDASTTRHTSLSPLDTHDKQLMRHVSKNLLNYFEQSEKRIEHVVNQSNDNMRPQCHVRSRSNSSERSSKTNTDFMTLSYDAQLIASQQQHQHNQQPSQKHLHTHVCSMANRCTCEEKFQLDKLGEGKYRIGNTNTIIFVRVSFANQVLNLILRHRFL